MGEPEWLWALFSMSAAASIVVVFTSVNYKLLDKELNEGVWGLAPLCWLVLWAILAILFRTLTPLA